MTTLPLQLTVEIISWTKKPTTSVKTHIAVCSFSETAKKLWSLFFSSQLSDVALAHFCQSSNCMKSTGLDTQKFKLWVLSLSYLCLWTGYLTSLNLHFLICKLGGWTDWSWIPLPALILFVFYHGSYHLILAHYCIWQNSTSVYDKNSYKLGIEVNFPSLVKGIYEQSLTS